MKIIKNFLPQEYFKKIQECLLGTNFPWYFYSGILNLESTENDDYHFVHTFYENNLIFSTYYEIFLPLLEKLNCKSVIRIKANLTTYNKTIKYQKFHKDFENNKTAILYLDNSNGYTEFKTGEIIKSEENKVVIFDSNILHRGINTTDKKRRIVLNINYYENI